MPIGVRRHGTAVGRLRDHEAKRTMRLHARQHLSGGRSRQDGADAQLPAEALDESATAWWNSSMMTTSRYAGSTPGFRRGTTGGQRTGVHARGSPRQPREAVTLILEANRTLSQEAAGGDAIREPLKVTALEHRGASDA